MEHGCISKVGTVGGTHFSLNHGRKGRRWAKDFMTNNSGWYESLYRLPSVLYGVGDETSTMVLIRLTSFIPQFSSLGWQYC